jgi:hypothetical protein
MGAGLTKLGSWVFNQRIMRRRGVLTAERVLHSLRVPPASAMLARRGAVA